MSNRLKRVRAYCSWLFPHSSNPPFSFYEDDVWIEIAKHLDGKSIAKLASTSKWFYKVVNEECVWKYACLRDLGMPDPGNVSFKWKYLYVSAFDGSHSYWFRQPQKHIAGVRAGAFFLDSPAAFLTNKLSCPKRMVKKDTIGEMLESYGLCVVTNIKTGIWIADLHLVRCPVCDLTTCQGTMQTLDARHFELFLSQGYQNGTWDFTQLGSHETKRDVLVASAAICELNHLKDDSTAEVFKTKTWFGKQDDLQPKGLITLHAVAINTNLQENQGLNTKFYVMRAGTNDQIVAIRVSQQLV